MGVKLGVLSTHPIQYHSPLYRELAGRPEIDLTVYYAHRATAKDQAAAGFGVDFEWDVPLLDGYRSEFLPNESRNPGPSRYAGCDTPSIADVIARERFDAFLVHGWHTKSYWQAMRACWRTRTPLMVRGDSTLLMARGWVRRLAKRLSHRRFVPRFDAYLVVGQRAREYYLAYGADPDRMTFCPHFVDNDRFAKAAAAARERQSELRAAWGLPAKAVVFVFAGKFISKKRPFDFVRAISAMARSDQPAAGLMVGDGPLRPAVEAAISELRAPVRLTGFLNQTQMPTAFAASDVVVLPSDGTETWGLVVNEAMACGLPAIVCDRVGCAPDLVEEDKTGFVYGFADVNALAKSMCKIMADQVRLSQMGVNARAHIDRFSVYGAADGVSQAISRLPIESCAQIRT